MDEIWVFSENIKSTYELLSKASEIASKVNFKVSAVVIGGKNERIDEIFHYGADKVYVIEDESLINVIPEVYADILYKMIKKHSPNMIIISSTKNGKEIASRVAAKLKVGCATECIDIEFNLKTLKVKRAVYAGKAIATEIIKSKPAIVTVPPRTFEMVRREGKVGEIIRVSGIELLEPRIKIIEEREKEARGVSLEEAEILVVGGRGFKRKEDFKMLEELAELLKGQVSCSRPISADLKWLPDWIGLSGHKVKPKLYIGFGVSGAVQHLAGIQGSKIIIAVNKDPEAPIFKASDYGIVGDLYEVLPALIRALRKRKYAK